MLQEVKNLGPFMFLAFYAESAPEVIKKDLRARSKSTIELTTLDIFCFVISSYTALLLCFPTYSS